MDTKGLEWFKGTYYKQGGRATNSYTKEVVELNSIELSIYDFILGAQVLLQQDTTNDLLQEHILKAVDWFKDNNKHAYDKLLR